MAEDIHRERIGGILRALGPLLVVGQHHIDTAVRRIGLHVLWAVHARRAGEVRGNPRVDDDVTLRGETVRRRERTLPEHERQPFQAPVFVEFRHRQRA